MTVALCGPSSKFESYHRSVHHTAPTGSRLHTTTEQRASTAVGHRDLIMFTKTAVGIDGDTADMLRLCFVNKSSPTGTEADTCVVDISSSFGEPYTNIIFYSHLPILPIR